MAHAIEMRSDALMPNLISGSLPWTDHRLPISPRILVSPCRQFLSTSRRNTPMFGGRPGPWRCPEPGGAT